MVLRINAFRRGLVPRYRSAGLQLRQRSTCREGIAGQLFVAIYRDNPTC
jgi:hypothetical protein